MQIPQKKDREQGKEKVRRENVEIIGVNDFLKAQEVSKEKA